VSPADVSPSGHPQVLRRGTATELGSPRGGRGRGVQRPHQFYGLPPPVGSPSTASGTVSCSSLSCIGNEKFLRRQHMYRGSSDLISSLRLHTSSHLSSPPYTHRPGQPVKQELKDKNAADKGDGSSSSSCASAELAKMDELILPCC